MSDTSNKINNIELVALDMDGTTYALHGGIIKENIKSIIELQKKGIKVVFVTGRPLFNVLPEAEKLEMEKYSGYLVAYNGASIYDTNIKKEISSDHLPAKIVNEIFKVANENEIDVWCYSDNHEKIITNFKYDDFEEARFLDDKIQIEQRSRDSEFKIPAYKLLIKNDNPTAKGHQLIAEISKDNNLNIASGISPVYEVNSSKMNKGIAIKKLANLLDINLENIMAIGDGENDIPMLKIVGLPIAMQNAKSNVKKYAKRITDSNEKAGVAKAIRKYILDNKE